MIEIAELTDECALAYSGAPTMATRIVWPSYGRTHVSWRPLLDVPVCGHRERQVIGIEAREDLGQLAVPEIPY
jgi:hypothetical protein